MGYEARCRLITKQRKRLFVVVRSFFVVVRSFFLFFFSFVFLSICFD